MKLHPYWRLCRCCIIFTVFGLLCTATYGNEISAYYQLSLEELGKVTITSATGNKTPLNQAPSTASVITAAQIETMGAYTLDEVLETVPGLHVSLSALNRLNAVYSIRGIHTGFNPHVLLLLNGIPVQFSLQGGKPELLRMPTTAIAQVEVIRGPGSAVYGADAYAGIINIITKKASYDGNLTSGGRLGSFNYRELWTQLHGKMQGFDIMFNATYQQSDGDDSRLAFGDLQTHFDQAFATSASLAPSHLSTRYNVFDAHANIEHERLSANFWHWRSWDTGIGAGATQALDHEGYDDSRLFLADFTYHMQDNLLSWNNSVQFSYQHYDLTAHFNLLPPGALAPIGSDGNLNVSAPANIVSFPDGLIGNPGAQTQDTQVSFTSVFEKIVDHRIRLNIGIRHQSLDTRERKNFGPGVINPNDTVVNGILTDVSDGPYVFTKDTSRQTRYLSLQDEWQIGHHWQLTSGVRYDRYSDFGTTTNPRVALVWNTNQNLTMKLLYGSAFRAPSFSEQFNDNNPVLIGSQALAPETIDTHEFSINAQLSPTLSSAVNLFTYEAKGMIEFIPDQGEPTQTTNTATNARDQDGWGFEWEYHWVVSDNFSTSGNYSWQHSKDARTGRRIADAPENQLTVQLNYQLYANTHVHGKFNWVGTRYRTANDDRDPLDNNSTFDITIKRSKIFNRANFSITLKNLLNEDNYEPSDGTIPNDYKLEKRSIVAELSFTI